MKKALHGLLACYAALISSGCAGTAFLLQPGPSKSREAAPIVTGGGSALLYDRTDRVLYENAQEDGSVWLHYAVVLKNTNRFAIQIQASDVQLQAEKVPTLVPLSQVSPTPTALREDRVSTSQAQATETVIKEEPALKPAPAKPTVEMTTVLQPKKFSVRWEKPEADVKVESDDEEADSEWPPKRLSVPADGYARFPFSVRITKEVAKAYAGSAEPVQLTVSLTGSGATQLKLPLWIWRRK